MTIKKAILWAEDDYFLMEPMFDAIRDRGFEVINARNGNEVIKLLDENHAQLALIILDMAMPTGNSLSSYETHAGRRTGLALAREIRKNYPSIPLLGCSVSSEPEIVDWFMKYGSGYLQKPVLPTEVIVRIEDIVLIKKNTPQAKMLYCSWSRPPNLIRTKRLY